MRYLFFDIEGANCYNFVSKMCTFGYVITSTDFKVKYKIDVIINPETPFDKHIIKENMNAYPKSMYRKSPNFKYFYNSFKTILEENDQIIVGWSIENDVKYIYDACHRYECKQINYKFIDIQKVYMSVENLSSQPSLEDACKNYNIPTLTTHKSDDDAYLTMQLTKAICEKLNISLEKLVEKYNQHCSSVQEYSTRALSDEEIQFRIQRRKIIRVINHPVIKHKKSNPNINSDEIFAFSSDVIDEHCDDILDVLHYIIDCGALVTTDFKKSTTIVCDIKYIETLKNKENYKNNKIITYDELLKLINQIKVVAK